MPRSRARVRRQPKERTAPRTERQGRPSLPDPLEDVECLVDEADEGDDGPDELVELEPAAPVSRGSVRTATWRRSRVPYRLQDVLQARLAVTQAERRLVKAVQSARAHGATWEEVALALGMSRQGAAKRFG